MYTIYNIILLFEKKKKENVHYLLYNSSIQKRKMYTIYNIIPLFEKKKENVHYLLYNSSLQKKKNVHYL